MQLRKVAQGYGTAREAKDKFAKTTRGIREAVGAVPRIGASDDGGGVSVRADGANRRGPSGRGGVDLADPRRTAGEDPRPGEGSEARDRFLRDRGRAGESRGRRAGGRIGARGQGRSTYERFVAHG